MDPDERVLCVNRASVYDVVHLRVGYLKMRDHNWPDGLPFTWARRGDCEEDPSLKQLIPYIVVRCHNDVDGMLVYQRKSSGGDSRLAGLYSIGIGGHVNVTDSDSEGKRPVSAMLMVGAVREISEELRDVPPYQLSIRGLVYNDDTPVGRVHLGVVMEMATLRAYAFASDDGAVDGGSYMCREEILSGQHGRQLYEFEQWSQLLLNAPAAKFLG